MNDANESKKINICFPLSDTFWNVEHNARAQKNQPKYRLLNIFGFFHCILRALSSD